ncbi:ribonuclease J [Candidatus Woesebacteria bacterium]|nr:ribonuclease J [Candidatus Woesebacteria bacterium]MCD8526890.1 ribonuclease J [Candidatus Woesebacteria bacterium]MCD8546041.1 ribonuclease J [Candidatus Woesebacteria bacterium]
MTKIFPLGGISGVTKNLFVYEHNDDMLVVDCGIGFPDETMPGVEFLIPDSQYLQDRLAQGATLHAIVLSHGHDDHIAALPYVLREIDVDVPIFGSPLTAEFAMTRMADNGVEKEVQYFEDDGVLEFGPFQVENIRITHSIPDTRHLVIRTPDGVFYHGSDFKLDLTPVDGIPSDLQRVAEIGREGVLCAAIDCLRIERPLPAASESSVGAAIREEMRDVEGKVLVTLMSSSIHRIQQAVDVAAEYGRKVAFIGRSVEQNVNTAMNMGLLDIPQDMKVNKRRMDDIPDSELCVIIAGSQGQPGSSLVRAVFGSHRMISVSKGDKIIFSSDAIPGSEKDVYRTINRIASQGIEVAYAEMNPGLHVSGHASEYEQMILLHLLQPEYVFPIGGEDRHRVLFGLKVREHGYRPQQVVLPMDGKWVEFAGGKMRYSDEQIKLRERSVDSTGVADVISKHLSERETLGKNGAMVVSVLESAGTVDPDNIAIDMRGVALGEDVPQDELRDRIRQTVEELVETSDSSSQDLRRDVEKSIVRLLNDKFGLNPLVMVVISSVS